MAAPPPLETLPNTTHALSPVPDSNYERNEDEREYVTRQLQAHDKFDQYAGEDGINSVKDSEIYADPMESSSPFPIQAYKATPLSQMGLDNAVPPVSLSDATTSALDSGITKWASYTSTDMVADVLSSTTIFSEAPTQNQSWISNQSRAICMFPGCGKSMAGMSGYPLLIHIISHLSVITMEFITVECVEVLPSRVLLSLVSDIFCSEHCSSWVTIPEELPIPHPIPPETVPGKMKSMAESYWANYSDSGGKGLQRVCPNCVNRQFCVS